MRAAKTRMRSVFGQGGFLASVGALAALTASIVAFSADIALAQNAECARLQQAIAAHRGSSGAQGAVERQRAELARTSAYARSLGCGNRKFLIFGSDPPAQCGDLEGQISRMQANLSDLQARAGGGAGDLIARYNAECGHAQPSGPGNVFEALFGGLAKLGAPQDQEPRRPTPDSKTTAISRASRPPRARKAASRRMPARMRYACGPATAASSPFPIPAPGAGRTVSRTFADPSAPTQTWPSIRSRSAERSKRPLRQRASPTQICPTPANSRKATIRAALAGAKGRAGRTRSPTQKRATATRSTIFW